MSIHRHPRTLQTLATEHLECRSMGHAWTHRDDHDHEVIRGVLRSYRREEECMRCGAERTRQVTLGDWSYRQGRSEVGEVQTRSIRYPDGYLLKGQDRVTRYDALRASYGVAR